MIKLTVHKRMLIKTDFSLQAVLFTSDIYYILTFFQINCHTYNESSQCTSKSYLQQTPLKQSTVSKLSQNPMFWRSVVSIIVVNVGNISYWITYISVSQCNISFLLVHWVTVEQSQIEWR
jgi:hypothetical protein